MAFFHYGSDLPRTAVRHGTDARSVSLSGEELMPAHELFCSIELPGLVLDSHRV
jgi:hypothetical protein